MTKIKNNYILGISCGFHDSGAALINNGKVIGATLEESFTGIKHDESFPFKSIEWLLTSNNLTASDIDVVSFYENPKLKINRIEKSVKKGGFFNLLNSASIISRNKKAYDEIENTIKSIFGNEIEISYVEHHLSHLAYSYYTSPYERTAIVSVDGHHSGLEIQREIRETLGEENGTLRELFSGTFRPAIFIGMILAIFSQVQGINAIMYYAPDIFKQVGSGNESAFQQTVIVGIINVAFTWVAIYFVDKWGRKSLLLWGGAGMAISLFMVGAAFQFNWSGLIILIFILAYVACFAASYGPVTWVVIAEIFPIKLRGLAMSVSTLILWVAVYFVTQFFPILLELMGPAYTFWFFCLMSSMAFLYVMKMVPETKNKTLEEIEHSWSK
jgi:hypothetical protein